MNTKPLFITILVYFLTFLCFESSATHFVAGEINVQRVGNTSREYVFQLNLYVNSEADGSLLESIRNRTEATLIAIEEEAATVLPFTHSEERIPNTEVIKFVLLYRYTFKSPGDFTISFEEANRVANILNMNNSSNVLFYISTKLTINPFIGSNSTPVLTIPPVDFANKGNIYTHNPGAFDPDGDSLAFRIDVPFRQRDVAVPGYSDPNLTPGFNGRKEDESGDDEFFIDPITGTLTWDSPDHNSSINEINKYNVAIIVEEWRSGIKLSETRRDMQILVFDEENERPDLILPEDDCIIAGEIARDTIIANDPTDDLTPIDPITVTFEGGDLYNSAAGASLIRFSSTLDPTENKYEFVWPTNCNLIREQPYFTFLKVIDNPVLNIVKPLSHHDVWQLKVIAPPVENFKSTILTPNSIELTWDNYICQNSDSILIWRKAGCTTISPENCDTDPSAFGYTKIANLPITATNYVDNTLKKGTVYSYVVNIKTVNQISDESLGAISDTTCIELPLNVPLITKVSINETGFDDGEVQLEWIPPLSPDTNQCKSPYSYNVLERKVNEVDYTRIIENTSDTIAILTGRSTQSDQYEYIVELLCEQNAIGDSSDPASSVWLATTSVPDGVKLDWSANVPWENTGTGFYHYIYRKVENQSFTLIDSISPNSIEEMVYTDTGQHNNTPLDCDSVYQYFIDVRGSYLNDTLPFIIQNNSQINEANPQDITAPLPVTLTLLENPCDNIQGGLDCENGTFDTYETKIGWELSTQTNTQKCQEDIKQFFIYKKETSESEFILIDSTSDNNYTHTNLKDIAGCYMVKAVDFSGNESEPSNEVCIEVCESCFSYNLPNIFTPNNDGDNDFFIPINPPRFIEEVNFKVVNKWGKLVHQTNDICINWDGLNLTEGIYNYSASIRIKSLDQQCANKVIKGWVQIVK